MRSLFYLGTVLIMSQFLVSQTLNDITYLTQTSLNGSARYTAMAGAFGALGGDLTAISNNPAASSVFLNTEIGGSLNFQARENESKYYGEFTSLNEEAFYFDQLGAVFVFNNTNEENPWSRISAAINVNRVTNFDNQTSLSGINNTSIADYFLYYANGIAFEDFVPFGVRFVDSTHHFDSMMRSIDSIRLFDSLASSTACRLNNSAQRNARSD